MKSTIASHKRDHGGNLDAAMKRWGGTRSGWIDLSTGINPQPFAVPEFSQHDWTALPDRSAFDALVNAARAFWDVPERLDILPTNGASAAIAAMPHLFDGTTIHIPQPTYNEHAGAFHAFGWTKAQAREADVKVIVNPNNPNGCVWSKADLTHDQMVIDESFEDCMTGTTLLPHLNSQRQILLKSFGKFWGLAGLRLGFVIGDPKLVARASQLLGPWSVSGPALRIGTAALNDLQWANKTRIQLESSAVRLDELLGQIGIESVGGTPLFRLYETANALKFQEHLAEHHIWSRVFPYSDTWVRLGLPPSNAWSRLQAALAAL